MFEVPVNLRICMQSSSAFVIIAAMAPLKEATLLQLNSVCPSLSLSLCVWEKGTPGMCLGSRTLKQIFSSNLPPKLLFPWPKWRQYSGLPGRVQKRGLGGGRGGCGAVSGGGRRRRPRAVSHSLECQEWHKESRKRRHTQHGQAAWKGGRGEQRGEPRLALLTLYFSL